VALPVVDLSVGERGLDLHLRDLLGVEAHRAVGYIRPDERRERLHVLPARASSVAARARPLPLATEDAALAQGGVDDDVRNLPPVLDLALAEHEHVRGHEPPGERIAQAH
jgi:hypothetical protein